YFESFNNNQFNRLTPAWRLALPALSPKRDAHSTDTHLSVNGDLNSLPIISVCAYSAGYSTTNLHKKHP
ncbi:hypothetical protein, partial [Marinobacter changyiensis]|uniref:hypothetical protein n=1 Tax=Marinobacter changyiensis TaxID=2604091 RepID=UPI001C55143E